MAEKVVIGNAELWHGDCREVLPLLPRFAAVVTDPPYGMAGALDRKPQLDRNAWGKHYTGTECWPEWDKDTVKDGIAAALLQSDRAVVWGGQFYILPTTRCLLTWNKILRNWSSSEAEHAWTNLDKPNRVFDYSHGQLATEGKHYHPTQKPVPLMAWCLDQAGRPATVLDPFMGSGSTGVACVQLGLAFTGIERERGYFDSACERISRALAQGSLIPLDKAPVAVQQAMVL